MAGFAPNTSKRRRTTRKPVVVRQTVVTAPRRARRTGSAVEKKYLDTFTNDTSGPTTGAVFSCNLVPQGTTDVTRIGNKILVTKLNIRYTISSDDQTTGTFVNPHFRIIVGIDKQANGANPATAGTDLLDQSPITNLLGCYRNTDNVDRFVLLYDKVKQLTISSTNAAHTLLGSGPWYRIEKRLRVPVHFNSTTGAITEVRSNNIFVWYCTDTSVANIQFCTRIKYIDS